jgi:hypothetical protein
VGAEALILMLCLLFVRPIGSNLWWLMAIVVLFSVVYILTHVQVRYRAPTEPLIAIALAGFASRFLGARPPDDVTPGTTESSAGSDADR